MELKEEFKKINEDISSLIDENYLFNNEIIEIKNQLKDICEILENLTYKVNNLNLNNKICLSTDKQIISTDNLNLSTDNTCFTPSNTEKTPFSIGNEGVPTNKQTDKQTDKQVENSLENAIKMLNSLDSIKKELRLKFKRLTEQELAVFSALYQINEEKGFADYRLIAEKIKLTESSIRDYTRRLINKGIPIKKTKLNNKSVQLFISEDFKKIATLSTILKLREI